MGALHDYVDKYTLTIARDADPDAKSAMQEPKKLCGARSCMTVTVTLHCGANYLVPDCHTYCVSRNDSLGHYQCNFTAGRKVCHDGWYEPLTDCVKKKKGTSPFLVGLLAKITMHASSRTPPSWRATTEDPRN